MHAKYLLIVEPLLADVAFAEAFNVIVREFWFWVDLLIASPPQRQTRYCAIWRGSAAQDIFKYQLIGVCPKVPKARVFLSSLELP